jgi:hypothetical protein
MRSRGSKLDRREEIFHFFVAPLLKPVQPAMPIPEPELLVVVASGLLVLASTIRTTTRL